MKLINLLPKSRQTELRYEATYHSLVVIFSLSLMSFGLVFISQFATKFYLEEKAKSLNGQIEQLKSQVDKKENADVKKKIKAVNDVISDFNNLATSSPKWSKVLKAFAPLPPSGVKISSLNIDLNKKTIMISGYSPTRELVISLYNSILQDDQDFKNIDYPLENVAKAIDINFHFTFSIQDSLLK